MTPCTAVLWTWMFTLMPLSAQQEDASREDRFRVGVNLVTLRFTVTDSRGDFVSNLPKDLFTVLENSTEQEIVIFDKPRNRARRPRKIWLAFLIDVSGSTVATRSEEIVAAQTFLDNVTLPTRLGVYGFTDILIPFQGFTSDRSLILTAIQKARKHLGQTAIYASLNSLLRLMHSVADPEARKAVIVISDGLDDNYNRSASSISLAREVETVIYTIQVPSSAQIYLGGDSKIPDPTMQPNDGPFEEQKISAFRRLSRQTEGLAFSGFEAILDFDETLAEINDHLFGNLYSIGYYSQSPMSADLRNNILIRTANPKLRVASAFKKIPEHFDSKRSLLQVFFDTTGKKSVEPFLAEPFNEIGADIDILRQGGSSERPMGLPFRIKVNPFSFRGAYGRGVYTQLGVLGLLLDPHGNEIVRLREIFRVGLSRKEIKDGQAIIYSNRLLAPPGDYTLMVTILELSSWRMKSFYRKVSVRGKTP